MQGARPVTFSPCFWWLSTTAAWRIARRIDWMWQPQQRTPTFRPLLHLQEHVSADNLFQLAILPRLLLARSNKFHLLVARVLTFLVSTCSLLLCIIQHDIKSLEQRHSLQRSNLQTTLGSRIIIPFNGGEAQNPLLANRKDSLVSIFHDRL